MKLFTLWFTQSKNNDPHHWSLEQLKINRFWFCSVAKSCPTLCNPMGCSPPGFLALHHLLEFAQTHVHWIKDTIQPSHPLSSPSPPALSLSQHQGLFPWVFPMASSGQSFGVSASAAVIRTRLLFEWLCLKSNNAQSAWPCMETLWTPGLEGHQERWSPSLWGSHRSQGITERHFAATVTQGPGVSRQPRDKRETQRLVFCHVRDLWAGSASASWLCHHRNQYLWLSYIQL